MKTVSQTAAMLEAALQAKRIRDRELTKSKKPSTLKKVGKTVVFIFAPTQHVYLAWHVLWPSVFLSVVSQFSVKVA